MQTIQHLIAALQDFWANRQRRRTAMWVLGAVGLLVVAYGVYTYVDAQREIRRADDKKDEILAAFPTAEVDGVMQPDLRDASQTDLLLLALQRRNRDKAEQRSGQGMMFAGIGIVVLGLAYLVAPTGKSAAPADGSAPPLT